MSSSTTGAPVAFAATSVCVQHAAQFKRVVTVRRPQFSQASSGVSGSAMWRYMLLTDGHIAQQLSIAVSSPLKLRLHSVAPATAPPPLPPRERFAAAVVGLTQRRITLHQPHDDAPLLYAASVWSSAFYRLLMHPDPHRPLWDVFAARKLCVSRSILAVHYGLCPDLAPHFGVPPNTPMWAREYVFRHNRAVFLHVHEIFSPTLARFLGPMLPPAILANRPHCPRDP